MLLTLALAPMSLAGERLGPQGDVARERELSRLDSSTVAGVYAELVRQRFALEAIAASDGAAAREAAEIAEEWDARIGEPMALIAAFLGERVDRWEDRREALERRAQERAARPFADAEETRRALESARAVLRHRAPAPVSELLISFDPRLGGDGLAQLEAGLATPLRVDGSGASEGLVLDLTTPRSWLVGHSRGGGAVLKSASRAGAGLSSIFIRVVPLEGDRRDFTHENLIEYTTPKGVERVHPGAVFVERGDIALFGDPAAWSMWEHESSSRYGARRGVTKEYIAHLDGNLVKIEAAVQDSGRSAEALLAMRALREEFERVEPLFDELVRRWRWSRGGSASDRSSRRPDPSPGSASPGR